MMYCHDPRILKHIHSTISNKSAPMRVRGANYLLMALSIWDPEIIHANLEIVEECLHK